jgi:acyl-coenzyme A synthetase/AMP-(fatty) acid ligase
MDIISPDVLRALYDPARESLGRKIAFADECRKLTYRDLRTEVDRGAAALLTHGIRAGDVVAATLPNSADASVLFLAVLRAGAVWVGIEPRTSAHKRKQTVSEFNAHFIDAVRWQDMREDVPGTVASILGPLPRPDLPAAIARTSGTTGTPKTIVHTRSDISLTAEGYASVQPQSLRVGVCLQLSILNLQILGTCAGIYSGATTFNLSRMDAHGVADAVWKYRLQKLRALVPATVYDLVHDPGISSDALRSLTDAGCGGAALSESLRREFERKFGVRVVGSYGLTEAPAAVAVEDSSFPRVPGTSGRTLPHIRLEALDDDGMRVPVGTDGALWVSPSTDGRYADLYRKTTWRWAAGKFERAIDHERSVRTGDIGRFDSDGNLTVTGRESDILIRGGANISASELESIFSELPEVSGVGVVGLPDERLGQHVLVLIEPSTGIPGDGGRERLLQQLETFCKERFLPGKGPDRIVLVDNLPRNSMGKVSRTELTALVPR